MLNILRSIIQEVNDAAGLDQALDIIVRRVKIALQIDVASIYLCNGEERELVLMATDGLNAEMIGQIRMRFDEGLVGLVAERAEPLSFDNAPQHPRYHFFPETGEGRYQSFLGVPVIHHRNVVGVLVAQRHDAVAFDEDMVTLMVTIAAQLAGAIAHARASGAVNEVNIDRSISLHPLQGLAGAPGVGMGTAVAMHMATDIDSIPDRIPTDIDREIRRFEAAVESVKRDISSMMERFHTTIPAGDVALFDAYSLMLESDSLIGVTIQRIKTGNWAPGALRETVTEHTRVFERMEDEYLRERAQDVRDLGCRLLMRLEQGEGEEKVYPADMILIGEEITASMLADIPVSCVRGVVSVRGSQNSHVAILTRAMGVPAVMGAFDLPVKRIDGSQLIVDGYSGRVYVNPNEAATAEYQRLQRDEAELSGDLDKLRDEVAETPDKVRVQLYVNTGLIADIKPALNSGAEGVGLYRTEFSFMIRERFPGEEHQYSIYRAVLESFAPRPVTMRTLDIGGDKSLPYFPISEDNPFLGWRGIRVTLDHPEIFLVQIRAMLRANEGLGNLKILLPMISSVNELEEAFGWIHRAHDELLEEGHDISLPEIGVMIEVPSAVFQADILARSVDFLSIGTNDLTQYLLAVDRNNARVAELYDVLHPAVLLALQHVVGCARRYATHVSVCGEMAGDPAAALALLGIGINSLSMNASSMPRIKWVIRNFTQREARKLLRDSLSLDSAAQVRHYFNVALERAGLGGLVRAGK